MQVPLNSLISSCALHFLKSAPVIVEHRLVCLKQGPLRVQDKDMLRKEIYELAKLPPILSELVFSLLAIINVGACTVPPDDLAGFIAKWLGANEKPAVGSVMPAKTSLYFACFS